MEIVKAAHWKTPADVGHSFNTVDQLGLGSGRFIFDIGGNRWRIVAWINFEREW